MKIFKVVSLVVLIIAMIIGITYMFLPSTARVQRSIVINAQLAKVFATLNQLETFNEWSPWYEKDPDAFFTLDGPKNGVGAKLSWKSEHNDVGSGSMTIVASEPNHLVRYKMQFDAYSGEPYADYILKDLDSATQVTWTYEERVDGLDRFRALGMDAFLGQDYEHGLENLKKYIENLPDYRGDISIQQIDSVRFVGMEATLEGDEISLLSTKMGQMFDILDQLIREKQLEVIGQPLCLYHAYNADEIDFETGIPVATLPNLVNGNFTGNIISAGKAVVAVHKGSYGNLPETYGEIRKFMDAKNLKPSGDMWEVYVTDPAMEPDTSQWITKVYVKIKD